MSLDVPSTVDSGDKPKLGIPAIKIHARLRGFWFKTPNLNILVNSTSAAEVAPEDNPCLCSSTIYSLVSACRLCQDGDPQLEHPGWESWKRNCTNSTGEPADYPYEIPGGTAVPNWAYLSSDSRPNFDARVAEADARTNPPESTPPSVPTQTATSSDNQSTEPSTIARRGVAPSAAYMRAHGGKLPTYRESLQGGVFPLRNEKGADMIETNPSESRFIRTVFRTIPWNFTCI
ncbi:hypothetical protein MPER_12040 [Moniliophthora perniciosa FA553]|nr:hypothetical protein MPER_12040 [Moniliophthora perniciosa FA553]